MPNDEVQRIVLERAVRPVSAQVDDPRGSSARSSALKRACRSARLTIRSSSVLREIDEGAQLRRDRDALVDRALDGDAAVRVNPRMTVLGRSRDVDRPPVPLHEVPQRRGRVVAEHRVGPTRLHRRQPAPLQRNVVVPPGVHAVIEAVKDAPLDPDPDRHRRQAAREQIVVIEDTPLARGEARGLAIGIRGHSAFPCNGL